MANESHARPHAGDAVDAGEPVERTALLRDVLRNAFLLEVVHLEPDVRKILRMAVRSGGAPGYRRSQRYLDLRALAELYVGDLARHPKLTRCIYDETVVLAIDTLLPEHADWLRIHDGAFAAQRDGVDACEDMCVSNDMHDRAGRHASREVLLDPVGVLLQQAGRQHLGNLRDDGAIVTYLTPEGRNARLERYAARRRWLAHLDMPA